MDTFPHERLNAIKGVITSENLSDNSDEEVLEWVTGQGFPASSIYRFPRRETLQHTFRQTAAITFQLHRLPMEIDIALEKCKVRSSVYSPGATLVGGGGGLTGSWSRAARSVQAIHTFGGIRTICTHLMSTFARTIDMTIPLTSEASLRVWYVRSNFTFFKCNVYFHG